MSNVQYDAENLTITLSGLEDVQRALGSMKSKTPAVAKVAVNSTARYARRAMIQQAKARYAVGEVGKKHLADLVQRKKATNRSISAELFVSSMRNDLSYFEIKPSRPFMGTDVWNAPEYFTGRVLKSSPMKELKDSGNRSKGFLVRYNTGHVGMVQRVIGSNTKKTTTMSGKPRWRTADGRVEKLITMGAPSITAMHHTIWPFVRPDAEVYLETKLYERLDRVLENARRKR